MSEYVCRFSRQDVFQTMFMLCKLFPAVWKLYVVMDEALIDVASRCVCVYDREGTRKREKERKRERDRKRQRRGQSKSTPPVTLALSPQPCHS